MNRRLYRSRSDSVLGGVAGGVADYLDIDPSIVRIVWAILALVTGGIFLVLYIVMWIVVPEGPGTVMPPQGVAGMPAAGMAAAAAPGATTPEGAATAATGQGWTAPPSARHRRGSGGAVVFGLILIAAGVWFLVDEYLPAFDRDLVWPIALVFVGGALLVVSLRRPRAE